MSLDLSIEHRRDAMKFHIKSSSYLTMLTMPVLCLLCTFITTGFGFGLELVFDCVIAKVHKTVKA